MRFKKKQLDASKAVHPSTSKPAKGELRASLTYDWHYPEDAERYLAWRFKVEIFEEHWLYPFDLRWQDWDDLCRHMSWYVAPTDKRSGFDTQDEAHEAACLRMEEIRAYYVDEDKPKRKVVTIEECT